MESHCVWAGIGKLNTDLTVESEGSSWLGLYDEEIQEKLNWNKYRRQFVAISKVEL